jgi:hypothetical protein
MHGPVALLIIYALACPDHLPLSQQQGKGQGCIMTAIDGIARTAFFLRA